MELIIFCVIIVAIFLYVMIRGAWDEKQQKMRYRNYLRASYGSFSEKEYTSEELDRIARFYQRKHAENIVDDITWNDLNMDGIFAMMNYAQSSAGEEYLYAMLRQPRLSNEDGSLSRMETHINYMMSHEDDRLDTMMLLNELGKTGKYSIFDYMDYLENLGKKSNIKHYIANLLLLACVGIIYVEASVGVMLLIAVACINIVMYMKEKNTVAPYVTTFAYVMRMLGCADQIIHKSYGSEMDDYLRSLQEKRGKFKVFVKDSGMVLKIGNEGGSIGDIILDYIKMVTHIDLIKFNKMLRILQDNKQESMDIVEAIGYLDAVISIGYFRAALPHYCVPELVEGFDEPLTISEGFHPTIAHPVSNSFSQKKGMLVTGSNASGKSTFLKMTAINAVLAQTIHTCAAKSYHGNYYRIYSSMALRDNLASGESYYIVEIKALKRIVDAAAESSQIPLLCFVDEVLRGTNTVERIAASVQILRKLSEHGIYCFAATHDIELTHLLEDVYDNCHFEEEVRDGDVLFSYRLLDGRAHTRNAIRLLEIIGFSDEIIKKADNMAKNFLETGEWNGGFK